MKTKFWITIPVFILLAFAFIYYHQTHISIWGFNLSKSDIKDVIVQTRDHSYIITDKKEISYITEMVSDFEKTQKIEIGNFPPQTAPKKYVKILIRTKNNATYGGGFWLMGDRVVQSSNGYYWRVDFNKLSANLDTSLKNSKMIN